MCDMYVTVADIPFMPTDSSRQELFDHRMFESIVYISQPQEMFFMVGYPQAAKNCIMVHLLRSFQAIVSQWSSGYIQRLYKMSHMYPLHQRSAVPAQNRRELHFHKKEQRLRY
jgi:hypothetical protein